MGGDAMRDYQGRKVLVTGAGITIIKSFEESTLDEWDRTMGVNLRSMLLCTKRASYITGVTPPVTGGAELATRPLRPEDG